MLDTIVDDGLNPRFIHRSPVFRDELGSNQMLAPERLASHIVEAVDSFHAGDGRCADQIDIVRDLEIEYLAPVVGAGLIRIDVWLDAIDPTTCTYAFLCSSDDGMTPHARGQRMISRIDPMRLRPARWSSDFMERQSSIRKTLHSYS